jgi:hypothetical protein
LGDLEAAFVGDDGFEVVELGGLEGLDGLVDAIGEVVTRGDCGRVREVGAVFLEAGELEGEGSGVGFIGEEQVEDSGEEGLSEVESAIGHGAVGDFEHGFEDAEMFILGVEAGESESCDIGGSFESASELEEPPCVAAGHIFGLEAGEGGEVSDEVIEEEQAVGEAGVSGGWAGIVLESVESAPGIGGEAVADVPGDAVQTAEEFGESAEAVGFVDECVGFAGEGSDGEVVFELIGEDFEVDHHLDEAQEVGGFIEGGFTDEAGEDTAESAGEVLESFAIATEPEEVIGDTAGDFSGGAFESCGAGWGMDEADGCDGGFGENPGILGGAAAA